MGPPASMKIPTAEVVSELKAAGFKVSVESNLLPHQHIFIAE
jgi:predicted methyltransferase